MDAELVEVKKFIRAIPPFDHLSDNEVSKLANHITIQYVRKHESMPPDGETSPYLYLIKKGALAYFDENNALMSKYAEGELSSVYLSPEDNQAIRVEVIEDTLLYGIPAELLTETIADNPEASAFFAQTAEQRLNKRLRRLNNDAVLNATLSNTLIKHFYRTPIATIDRNKSIQDCAIEMTNKGFSCLVVTERGNMVGIVTDKDLRRRCVAVGLDVNMPITNIMSNQVTTIDINHSAYDALIEMTSKGIHHLPVTENGQLAGMVTVTDLMNQQGNNAVNMVSLIRKADSIKSLQNISLLLPNLQQQMASLGSSAEHVGKSISAITMAFTVRLIKMAEHLLGPAPVPFAWLAAGSQARQEQLCHSDQDNALIISDEYQDEHDSYFADLANFVCDGLAACGFVYCPGNIMASNKQWRQPQQVWQRYFDNWVQQPKPDALLNASVFFDLTTVYGDKTLLEQVRTNMLSNTKGNSLFIAHLSKNALMLKPPLGFFRDFVLVESGDNEKALDLKHNGIAPIVDLARIYALNEGVSAVSTLDRLKAVSGTSSLTKSSAKSLIDAFEFISLLRLQHQSNRLKSAKSPNNFMPPNAISKLEREHLKDAFKVIKTLQDNRQVTY